MKERPILFQGAMVRALLAGTKTQTRRVVKGERASRGMESGWLLKPYGFLSDRQFAKAASPYGRPGDRLWVRETWCHTGTGVWTIASARMALDGAPIYRADGERPEIKWWPGIHMPREFCRILLEVTGIRVERLQDISEADAIAEGIGGLPGDTPQRAYRSLWNSINLPPSSVQERIAGKLVTVAYVSYPWSMEDFEHAYPGVATSGLYRGKPLTITPNPWVWVISFRRNT